jgi:taurine dioxygenase
MGMMIQPLSSRLGAVVADVDVRRLDDGEIDQLHAALMEHQVLFLPGQQLSDDEHIEFASRWGTVSRFPIQQMMDTPARVSYIRDSADSPPQADGWHTDITWIPDAPTIAFLHAQLIPARGGDTMWADLYAAWDALSVPVRSLFEQLSAFHDKGDVIRNAARSFMTPEQFSAFEARFPGTSWPLARQHDVTGKTVLWFSGFIREIEGVTPTESAVLMMLLRSHINDPNFACRWSWTAGDLAIWDERSTNHRALSDHFPADRVMRRCTIDADRRAPAH